MFAANPENTKFIPDEEFEVRLIKAEQMSFNFTGYKLMIRVTNIANIKWKMVNRNLI